jgi:VPDSG-CTERM motif
MWEDGTGRDRKARARKRLAMADCGMCAAFTLIAVPDSGSKFALLLLTFAALFGLSRFRSRRLA